MNKFKLFLLIIIISLLGILALIISVRKNNHQSSSSRTFYVDALHGDDSKEGTLKAPWRSLDYAISKISSGDTLIINSGIYKQKQVKFGPAGVNAEKRTIFKALPGARVIITGEDETPPRISLDNYVRLEGLWMGGKRTSGSKSAILTGGRPVGIGKQIINCTIFGFSEGISQGSAEYSLYQGNRFVNIGEGRFKHGIYISGGLKEGEMATHTIVDSNIFVAGEGYAIHGWHNTHSNIITRNFIAGHFWGLVMDGSDHLIANNIFWKQTGQTGRESAWGPWLPGKHIWFINNILGPMGGMGPQPKEDNLSTDTINHNVSISNSLNELGISETEIDGAIQRLTRAFLQPVDQIYNNKNIEGDLAKLIS